MKMPSMKLSLLSAGHASWIYWACLTNVSIYCDVNLKIILMHGVGLFFLQWL